MDDDCWVFVIYFLCDFYDIFRLISGNLSLDFSYDKFCPRAGFLWSRTQTWESKGETELNVQVYWKLLKSIS